MDENGSIDKNWSILKLSGNEVYRLGVKLLIFEAKAIKFQDKILCYFRGEWGGGADLMENVCQRWIRLSWTRTKLTIWKTQEHSQQDVQGGYPFHLKERKRKSVILLLEIFEFQHQMPYE